MKVFLIVIAVLVVIFAIILSLSAELTVIYDNGWTTRVSVLFIEKDIKLSKVLSFLLFPEKAAADVSEEKRKGRENKDKAENDVKVKSDTKTDTVHIDNKKTEKNDDIVSHSNDNNEENEKSAEQQQPQVKEPKPNYIKKLFDKEGVLGIMLLLSNLLQSANSAVTTLIKGLHIYSLYVKMIIGGNDAADIGHTYGTVCGVYYPLKGIILNGMKVDQYDDYIVPDFIAPRSEYEFQIIASINIALLLKVALNALKVFLTNLIKNK